MDVIGKHLRSGELMRLLEEKNAPEPLLQFIWTLQMNAVYLQYDTSRDFFPQFQENAEKLLSFTEAIRERMTNDEDGLMQLLKGLEAKLHGQIGPAR